MKANTHYFPGIFLVFFMFFSGALCCQNTDIDNYIIMKKSNNENENQLAKYALYNLWANQQIVKWLNNADDNQWQQEVESSFNSLKSTLIHLWNAEHGWLQTLLKLPWEQAIAPEKEMAKNLMLSGFLLTSKRFAEFVNNLEDADFKSVRNFGNNKADVSAADIILHVFNHATYHRGQLITIGRQVGLSEPPRTDYIYFINL
jgi:uncharacterized damage-inducible protein DinB